MTLSMGDARIDSNLIAVVVCFQPLSEALRQTRYFREVIDVPEGQPLPAAISQIRGASPDEIAVLFTARSGPPDRMAEPLYRVGYRVVVLAEGVVDDFEEGPPIVRAPFSVNEVLVALSSQRGVNHMLPVEWGFERLSFESIPGPEEFVSSAGGPESHIPPAWESSVEEPGLVDTGAASSGGFAVPGDEVSADLLVAPEPLPAEDLAEASTPDTGEWFGDEEIEDEEQDSALEALTAPVDSDGATAGATPAPAVESEVPDWVRELTAETADDSSDVLGVLPTETAEPQPSEAFDALSGEVPDFAASPPPAWASALEPGISAESVRDFLDEDVAGESPVDERPAWAQPEAVISGGEITPPVEATFVPPPASQNGGAPHIEAASEDGEASAVPGDDLGDLFLGEGEEELPAWASGAAVQSAPEGEEDWPTTDTPNHFGADDEPSWASSGLAPRPWDEQPGSEEHASSRVAGVSSESLQDMGFWGNHQTGESSFVVPPRAAELGLAPGIHMQLDGPAPKVIVFTAPKGGAGKSSMSLYSSAFFATVMHAIGKKVVLLDANFGQADLHHYIRNEGTADISQLAKERRLTPEMVRSVLTEVTPKGGKGNDLSILFGPRDYASYDPEVINATLYAEVTSILSDEFDYVLVDTPAAVKDSPFFNQFILRQGDYLVLVVPPLIPVVSRTGAWAKTISLSTAAGGRNFPARNMGVLLNREREGNSCDSSLVKTMLSDLQFLGSIPDDPIFSEAVNQGMIPDSPALPSRFARMFYTVTGEMALLDHVIDDGTKEPTTPPRQRNRWAGRVRAGR